MIPPVEIAVAFGFDLELKKGIVTPSTPHSAPTKYNKNDSAMPLIVCGGRPIPIEKTTEHTSAMLTALG